MISGNQWEFLGTHPPHIRGRHYCIPLLFAINKRKTACHNEKAKKVIIVPSYIL
jgi:hypothetical protein